MKTKEILSKIYKDRQQMCDDMMYFYDEKECQEAFGMSIDEVLELMPNDFDLVVQADEEGLITYGNFEKVYEEYIGIDWKEIALNLLSLAETLEYFGDYEDGLRGRLREEVGLNEEQLDKLGV
jgi:hypothetical protein